MQTTDNPETRNLNAQLRERREQVISAIKAAAMQERDPITTSAQVDNLIARVRQAGALADLQVASNPMGTLGLDHNDLESRAALFAEIQFNRILEVYNIDDTRQLHTQLQARREQVIAAIKTAAMRGENPTITPVKVSELVVRLSQAETLTLAGLRAEAGPMRELGLDNTDLESSAALFAEIQFRRLLRTFDTDETRSLHDQLQAKRETVIKALKNAAIQETDPIITPDQVDGLVRTISHGECDLTNLQTTMETLGLDYETVDRRQELFAEGQFNLILFRAMLEEREVLQELLLENRDSIIEKLKTYENPDDVESAYESMVDLATPQENLAGRMESLGISREQAEKLYAENQQPNKAFWASSGIGLGAGIVAGIVMGLTAGLGAGIGLAVGIVVVGMIIGALKKRQINKAREEAKTHLSDSSLVRPTARAREGAKKITRKPKPKPTRAETSAPRGSL